MIDSRIAWLLCIKTGYIGEVGEEAYLTDLTDITGKNIGHRLRTQITHFYPTNTCYCVIVNE